MKTILWFMSLGMIGAFVGVWFSKYTIPDDMFLPIVVSGAGLFSLLAGLLARLTFEQIQETQQSRAIVAAEAKAAQEQDFVEFLLAELSVVTARARLNMLTAENRANRLYVIGIVLTIASVFAPVVSGLVYFYTDPVDQSIAAALETLKTAEGVLPPGVNVTLQRDWRVLISGISFGFLFLAAARGVLNQHLRQSETYFDLAREVTSFENLKVAIRIRRESGKHEPEGMIRDAANVIVERLLGGEAMPDKRD